MCIDKWNLWGHWSSGTQDLLLHVCLFYSRTSTEQLKPSRSCKDSSAEPNDFNTTLLQQLKPIPINQTNPSPSERSFYSQSLLANRDPNVKPVFLNPILQQGPPNLQEKKPEIIHLVGTKKSLEAQLQPSLQTGFQAPPMPGVSLTSQQILGTQRIHTGFQAPAMLGAFSSSLLFTHPPHQLGFQAPPMPGVSTLVAFSEGKSVKFSLDIER